MARMANLIHHGGGDDVGGRPGDGRSVWRIAIATTTAGTSSATSMVPSIQALMTDLVPACHGLESD